MWVSHLLEVSQPGQLFLESSRGRYMSSELQLDFRHLNTTIQEALSSFVNKNRTCENGGK